MDKDEALLIAAEITRCLSTILEDDCLSECGSSVVRSLRVRPDHVLSLAHRMLHAFHYSLVPTCWRRCFEDASLWRVIQLLEKVEDNWQDEVISLLDLAIIMSGAPVRRPLIDAILEQVERLDTTRDTRNDGSERLLQNVMTSRGFPTNCRPTIKLQKPVSRCKRPSIMSFQRHVRDNRKPLVLQGTLEQWPAVVQWKKPEYWMQRTLQGRRRVPVEVGRSYTDESWGQKIMPFDAFMKQHLLNNDYSQPTGYLAQHDLLDQIPKLKRDVMIPDYCFIDLGTARTNPDTLDISMETVKTTAGHPDSDYEEDDPSPICNLWLGPAGTVSPCHTDPHHNLLAQVIGRKYVRLFDPKYTSFLHPMAVKEDGAPDLANTSQIDIGLDVELEEENAQVRATRLKAKATQDERFPDFTGQVDYLETILEPGELLYIPKGWWHYVKSLDISASVSFWWG